MSERTREALAYRRFERLMVSEGYVRISENGSPLGRLIRGSWVGRRIMDARVSPSGLSVFIKVV